MAALTAPRKVHARASLVPVADDSWKSPGPPDLTRAQMKMPPQTRGMANALNVNNHLIWCGRKKQVVNWISQKIKYAAMDLVVVSASVGSIFGIFVQESLYHVRYWISFSPIIYSPKDALEDEVQEQTAKVCLDSKPYHIEDCSNEDWEDTSPHAEGGSHPDWESDMVNTASATIDDGHRGTE
jgi:hypothetical protein